MPAVRAVAAAARLSAATSAALLPPAVTVASYGALMRLLTRACGTLALALASARRAAAAEAIAAAAAARDSAAAATSSAASGAEDAASAEASSWYSEPVPLTLLAALPGDAGGGDASDRLVPPERSPTLVPSSSVVLQMAEAAATPVQHLAESLLAPAAAGHALSPAAVATALDGIAASTGDSTVRIRRQLLVLLRERGPATAARLGAFYGLDASGEFPAAPLPEFDDASLLPEPIRQDNLVAATATAGASSSGEDVRAADAVAVENPTHLAAVGMHAATQEPPPSLYAKVVPCDSVAPEPAGESPPSVCTPAPAGPDASAAAEDSTSFAAVDAHVATQEPPPSFPPKAGPREGDAPIFAIASERPRSASPALYGPVASAAPTPVPTQQPPFVSPPALACPVAATTSSSVLAEPLGLPREPTTEVATPTAAPLHGTSASAVPAMCSVAQAAALMGCETSDIEFLLSTGQVACRRMGTFVRIHSETLRTLPVTRLADVLHRFAPTGGLPSLPEPELLRLGLARGGEAGVMPPPRHFTWLGSQCVTTRDLEAALAAAGGALVFTVPGSERAAQDSASEEAATAAPSSLSLAALASVAGMSLDDLSFVASLGILDAARAGLEGDGDGMAEAAIGSPSLFHVERATAALDAALVALPAACERYFDVVPGDEAGQAEVASAAADAGVRVIARHGAPHFAVDELLKTMVDVDACQ